MRSSRGARLGPACWGPPVPSTLCVFLYENWGKRTHGEERNPRKCAASGCSLALGSPFGTSGPPSRTPSLFLHSGARLPTSLSLRSRLTLAALRVVLSPLSPLGRPRECEKRRGERESPGEGSR